jgi:hypothetical protein
VVRPLAPPGRRRPRGLSLAEAVIAIFILTFGFAVVARLFHAGLAYEAHTDAQQMAALVAESKMEEIRGWNWQVHRPGSTVPGACAFSDWTAYPDIGAPIFNPSPNAPDFLVGVNSTLREIYSPCTQFESLYVANPNPDRQPRVAEQAAR